ncbi:SPOR domain-containing protein [uncultured Sphingomonas sp.]|uniref:SPOR domain-containing protein n=1 Tax=uncultured Sphingomonas sp. TaxID=158754 RepID=UPI0035CA082D
MRRICGALALLLATIAIPPAGADTKAGVDAWSRGDYRRAVDEWRAAAIAGDADAQFNLGQAYKLGRGVPTDLPMAESWYRKAALQGHALAEDNYGLALFQDGRRDEALPWLEKSVARGEPRAQLVLGTMLFNGDGVRRDWVRAYALMVRSSAAGLPQGSQTLADMDRYIPDDQRRQGIALARTLEQQQGQAQYTPDSAARTPPPTVTPGPSDTVARSSRQPAARPLPEPAPTAKPTPKPTVAAITPAAPAAAGRWRIQLGAFRDEGNARALWQRLRAQVDGLSGLQPYLRKVGAITKLQAGPIASAADASQLCATVRRAGSECVPVAP